ncbi:hypothetical protein HYU06_04760 [Candidatus Woesearchaeota archaeon]|nr:hypothetical protein [Candidatus Woesearchaeota archaeon]
MTRKTTKQLVETIKCSLSFEPRSIMEIAKESKTDWTSTEKCLDLLKSLEIVVETADGNKRLFCLKKIQSQEHTWFGIPIQLKEDQNKINFIYNKSIYHWLKKTGREIGKTQANKVLAKVNKDCNLNLPVGWYLYGQMCVEIFDLDTNYSFENFAEAEVIEKKIIEVIDVYSKIKKVSDLKKYHYKEFDNILYNAKEEILSLGFSNFEKDDTQEFNFIKRLLSMIESLPKTDEKIIELFTEYIGTTIQLLRKLTEEELLMVKADILSSFNEVWKLIAIQEFYESLLETKKYTKDTLHPFLSVEIMYQKEEVIEWLSRLQGFVLLNDTVQSPEYNELKRLQGSAKLLTEEEKRKVNSSDLLRQIGFDY